MKRSFNKQNKQPSFKGKSSIYTETSMDSSVLPPKMEDSTQSATRLLRTCGELSIRKFIRVHCHGDLSALIVKGFPSQEQLLEAWNEIVFEYSALLNSGESSHIQELTRTIGALQFVITYTENAVFLLRHRHDPDIVAELVRMGYRHLQFKEMDEDWQKQLNRVVSLCKTRVYDLEQAYDEYSRLQKTTEGKKQTEDEFNRNLLMLSKYQGYHLDKDSTMMDEYIGVFNNYMQEQRLMQKQNES